MQWGKLITRVFKVSMLFPSLNIAYTAVLPVYNRQNSQQPPRQHFLYADGNFKLLPQ